MMYVPVGSSVVGMPADVPSVMLTVTNGFLSYWEFAGELGIRG